MHNKPPRPALALTAALALTCATPALATNYTWTGGGGTDDRFSTTSNWTPGGYPDTGADKAIFNLFAVFTVDFNNDEINNDLDLSIGSPTLILWFDLDGNRDNADNVYHYTLDATATRSANISSLPGALILPVLTLEGGHSIGGGAFGPPDDRSSVQATQSLHIGLDDNTKGQLNLDAAEWNTTGSIHVGVSGTGTLNIMENGRASNSNGFIGQNPGSKGTVNIATGPGTSGDWFNADSLFVGWFGDGTLNNAGGLFADNTFIGSESGATGNLNMTSGFWDNDNSLYIAGDTTAPGGSGQLNHSNGTIIIKDSIVIWNNGDLTTSDGTIDVTNNLTLKNSASMTISGGGAFSGGEVTVAGNTQLDPASSLTIDNPDAFLTTATFNSAPTSTLDFTAGTINVTAGDFTVDTDAATPSTFVIATDMALNVSDTLRVGPIAGGALSIVGGATVTAGDLHIGNTPASTTTIAVDVDAPGSTLTIAGDITMGSASSAGAQLVVTNHAVAQNNNAIISPLPTQHSELLIQSPASGTAQWHNAGSVYLGGTDTTPGGTAILDINTGGVVTIAATLRVWDNATLNIDNGSLTTPLLHHAGTFNSTAPLDLTGTGPITALILDGGTINAPEIDLGDNDHNAHGQLNGDVIAHGAITANGTLTMGDPTSFTGLTLTGPLDVGTHTVNLHKAGFFNIGPFTTINGGTLNVPNGVAIPVGNSILAHGAITGRLVQQSGSTIIANTGNLTLGDPASLAGFFSDGELVVDNNHTVTLLDANQAVLGSLTTLGTIPETKGNLNAPNGLLVEFGKNIQGFGTLTTPNNPDTPLTNNGHIQGLAPDATLRLTGYVKGVGTFQDVLFLGTLAPGFSPGIVNATNIAFGPSATFDVDVLSSDTPIPGTHHDQLNITNNVTLNGTLNILPSPNPASLTTTALGTEFPILTYDTRTTFYHTVTGALLATNFALAPLINDTDDTLILRASIPGDTNLDNIVSIADLSTFALNFATTPGLYNETTNMNSWQLGDFNADGQITIADLSLLALNFGFALLEDGTTTPATPLSLSAIATLASLDLSAVPEPATLSLLTIAGLIHAPRRRNRNRNR